jgi:hypothetical protein
MKRISAGSRMKDKVFHLVEVRSAIRWLLELSAMVEKGRGDEGCRRKENSAQICVLLMIPFPSYTEGGNVGHGGVFNIMTAMEPCAA